MIKTKRFFWKAGFFTANQRFLKAFKIALISWKKAGPPKKRFCFDHTNRLILIFNSALNFKEQS